MTRVDSTTGVGSARWPVLPGATRRARRAIHPWTAVAVGGAAAIALLMAALIVPPSHADLREAAEALVPPSAVVGERGENTGSEMIAGSYFAFVEFRGDASDAEELHRRAIAHAESTGWSTTETRDHANGYETWFNQNRQIANLVVFADSLSGLIQVREDRGASGGTILAITLAAPLVVLLGAVVAAAAWPQRPGSAAS